MEEIKFSKKLNEKLHNHTIMGIDLLVDFDGFLEQEMLFVETYSPEIKSEINEITQKIKEALGEIYKVNRQHISNEEKADKIEKISNEKIQDLLKRVKEEEKAVEAELQARTLQIAANVKNFAEERAKDISGAIKDNIKIEEEHLKLLQQESKEIQEETKRTEKNEADSQEIPPRVRRVERNKELYAKRERTRRSEKTEERIDNEIRRLEEEYDDTKKELCNNKKEQSLMKVEATRFGFFHNLKQILRNGKIYPDTKMKFLSALKLAFDRTNRKVENAKTAKYARDLEDLYKNQIRIEEELETCMEKIRSMKREEKYVIRQIVSKGKETLKKVKDFFENSKSKGPIIEEVMRGTQNFEIQEAVRREKPIGKMRENREIIEDR